MDEESVEGSFFSAGNKIPTFRIPNMEILFYNCIPRSRLHINASLTRRKDSVFNRISRFSVFPRETFYIICSAIKLALDVGFALKCFGGGEGVKADEDGIGTADVPR